MEKIKRRGESSMSEAKVIILVSSFVTTVLISIPLVVELFHRQARKKKVKMLVKASLKKIIHSFTVKSRRN